MTERLYGLDPYLRQFTATIVERTAHHGRPALVLDRTAFYPTGGGQPHGYTLGVGSVALGRSFPVFLDSMVVLTVAEMWMIPTATTLTANLALPEARGRYRSVYGRTWGLSLALGPVIGGLLHDRVGPAAIGWGGGGMALAAALGFLGLLRVLGGALERREQAPA